MRVRIKYEEGITKDAAYAEAKVFVIPGSHANKLVKNPACSMAAFSFKP